MACGADESGGGMKYSLCGVSVYIAIPVNRDLPYQTVLSLLETVDMLNKRSIDYDIQLVTGVSIIEKSRSSLAHRFLKGSMTRLFWIDSDMSWSAESFLQVLSKTVAMDVVGATYPAKSPDLRFVLKADGGTLGSKPLKSNEHGCIPVRGMGLGFTCCRREVIERLAADAPKVTEDGEVVPMIFRSEVKDGSFYGEDMVFFGDCLKVGAGVWCDPAIELGHVGGHEYRGALASIMRNAR